ncbi:MAG: flagellar assembly protein FliH [Steroidobacteraceae bacterium]
MSEAALWALPVVEGRVPGARRERITADELEGISRAAWEEGHAKGHADGLAAAAAEAARLKELLDQRIARLDGLLTALAQPLADLDAEVEQQLAHLSLTVARHLVRRELRIDPAQVIGILRQAVSLLPAAARDVRIHLHPEDAALVNERLAVPATGQAWVVVEDPVMSRGGCRVTAENSQVDARLETRLNAALVAVLGEERSADLRGEP